MYVLGYPREALHPGSFIPENQFSFMSGRFVIHTKWLVSIPKRILYVKTNGTKIKVMQSNLIAFHKQTHIFSYIIYTTFFLNTETFDFDDETYI